MKLIQNNPYTFQTTDSHTLFGIQGDFKLNGKSLKIQDECLIVDDGVKILIVRQPNYIGGSFWLSSIAMILYLADIAIKDDCKVLELGAGIALPSLYLNARNKGIKLTCTDKEIWVTKNSVEINLANISVKSLDWDNMDDIGTYDLVLASDCVYRHNFECFVQTLKKVGHEKTQYIIFNAVREDSQEFVFLMQETFPDVSIEFVTMQVGDYDIDLLKMVV